MIDTTKWEDARVGTVHVDDDGSEWVNVSFKVALGQLFNLRLNSVQLAQLVREGSSSLNGPRYLDATSEYVNGPRPATV